MNVPFIEFSHVDFAYPGGKTLLSDINFRIEAGSFTAIMGGSGSGKTTLLRLLTGQLAPSRGQVLIGGKNLARMSAAERFAFRRNMGVLFQFGALFTDLSVGENIAFPLREHTRLPETAIADLVTLKLSAVGLRGTEKLMPGELSGGMARRVALARTMALDPALMLFDEPFTGLDPITLGVIAHLIARTTRALNATSVMVTHDVAETLPLVNQVIFLAHGEVIFSGTPAQMQEADSPWINQFVQGAPEGPVDYHYPNPATLKAALLAAPARV